MSYDTQCIEGKGLNEEIFLKRCELNNENQKWLWSLKNETAIEFVKEENKN